MLDIPSSTDHNSGPETNPSWNDEALTLMLGDGSGISRGKHSDVFRMAAESYGLVPVVACFAWLIDDRKLRNWR